MKKYIAPSLKVVNIESNTILAGSGTVGYSDTPINGDFGARGHRRGNLTDWDDDED